MNLFLVRAPRTFEDGTPISGAWRGYAWHRGYAGPFSEKDAKQVARTTGGSVFTLGSVSEQLVNNRINEIENELAEIRAADERAKIERERRKLGLDEVAEAVEEAVEAEETPAAEETPDADEIDHNEKLRLMGEAGFDWKSVTAGKRDKKSVAAAFAEFLKTF